MLRDKSSSLSELELPLACKPGGAPGREEDDEPDLFVSRDGGREYVGGEGVLALRGDERSGGEEILSTRPEAIAGPV